MGFIDKHIKSYRVILGSRSPRRKELLEGLGIDIEILVKDELPETYPSGMKPADIAQFLARTKAGPYLDELRKNDILITADTIVCFEDQILMKPATREQAVESLLLLSGQDHVVITGVCLSSPDKCSCFYSETHVKFAFLEINEINHYIDQFAPFDKAGSYGIQEWIGFVGVESINGSYFNVMGLPVQRLYTELKKFTGFSDKKHIQ